MGHVARVTLHHPCYRGVKVTSKTSVSGVTRWMRLG